MCSSTYEGDFFIVCQGVRECKGLRSPNRWLLCALQDFKGPLPLGNHGFLWSSAVVWACVFWLPAVTSDLTRSEGDHYRTTEGDVEEESQSCATLQGITVPQLATREETTKEDTGKKVSLPGIKTAGNFLNTSTHEPGKRVKPFLKPTWEGQWSV